MATGGIEMQSTECPVCHENYHEPKILPCAHLLCRDCLVSWMKKKTDALCPLCRSTVVEREDVISGNCEDIVDSLLTDHAMIAMVESVKILNERRVCHVHRGVGATSLCLHCNLKLCQSCVEVHKNLPLTGSHKVKDLGTITLECLASNRHEPCFDHPDKISELFCTAHNVLICHLCATSKHRTCPEVTCLKEVNEKYKQTLSDIKVKLTATVSRLNRVITKIDVHLAASKENTQEAFKRIDATCNALLNSVEACRKRLKKLVQDADDKIKATALEQKSSLAKRRGTLTSHLNLIERMQNTAHGSSLVAMVPKVENRIAKLLNLDEQKVPTRTWQGLRMMRLTIDQQIVGHVEQKLEKIGEISLYLPLKYVLEEIAGNFFAGMVKYTRDHSQQHSSMHFLCMSDIGSFPVVSLSLSPTDIMCLYGSACVGNSTSLECPFFQVDRKDSFGYLDLDYLKKVMEELAAKGISSQ